MNLSAYLDAAVKHIPYKNGGPPSSLLTTVKCPCMFLCEKSDLVRSLGLGAARIISLCAPGR